MVAEAATKAQDFLLPSPFTRTCLHKILQWWYTWTHTNKIVLFSPSTLLSLSLLLSLLTLYNSSFVLDSLFLVCPFARAHIPLSKTLRTRQVIQSSKVNCHRCATMWAIDCLARTHLFIVTLMLELYSDYTDWFEWLYSHCKFSGIMVIED